MSLKGQFRMGPAGWRYVTPCLLLVLLTAYLFSPIFALLPLLMAIFLAYLFRDPVRTVPALPLAVVSPVDAEVRRIHKVTDPYLERPSQRIDLVMELTSPYTVRSPIEGMIKELWQHVEHQRLTQAFWVQTDEADDVVFEFRRETIWRHLFCGAQAGERIGQGQRCGWIRFGAPVSVYLPESARLEVKEGDRVLAGTDCLAEFVHN